MHEMSAALSIAEIISESVSGKELGNILSVTIDVGLLSNISAESLTFCFDSIKADKPYRSAVLLINKLPVKISCNECGGISTENDYVFRCSICSSDNISVIGGDEFTLNKITIEPQEKTSWVL
jgi:hydrogenase nickel incorporation protein HypA/HybF